ncbi:CHAD domain-containing protein [Caballeronia arationis]|nr:CHAD domain-containing protein [Caballeronia arationis]
MPLNLAPATATAAMPHTPAAQATSRQAARSRRSISLRLGEQPVADAFVMLTAPLASDALQQTESLNAHSDADALHRLCTTLRRLHAIWWAFDPLLDEKHARLIRKRFRRLADIAGEPYELDAACGLLFRARKGGARFAPVVRTIDDERRDASISSCRAIRKAAIDVVLRRALADARRCLETREVDQTLEEFALARVCQADDALTRKEARLARMKRVDAKTLRGIGEAAGRLQCLIELFSPVLVQRHRHTMERLLAARATLGKLDDVVASEAVVRRMAARAADKHAVDEAVRWLHKERKDEVRAAFKMLRNARLKPSI